MRIAVCDDQHFFVDEIKNKIESYLNDKNIPFDLSLIHISEPTRP